ncbi:interferon lambda-4-like [Ochotona princeps]|uniref:interferon lambda-4-like n=1 Tax=Ochotona princeps TaxID=9978 RepID=UPI00271520DD|nr:interferon lambda-4-like [Ochotona princeps]
MGAGGAAAAVAAGLCFLWVLLVVTAKPVEMAPRRCLLSHYRSLDPKVLKATQELRNSYEEETLGWRLRTCSLRVRRDPPRPSSCARLRHVARGLADAQAVLSSLHRLERFPGVGPTLELLVAARRDVAACVELVRPRSSRKSSRATRRRAQTRRADPPRCHEAAVVFNLLRLLTWDLRLVAQDGPCV